MDAKPQRPQARIRVLGDENAVLSNMSKNVVAGKTLHQRTKSVPALNAPAMAKKVLGETQLKHNLKLGHQDDSEIGKSTPGKIQYTKEHALPQQVPTFSRPAVRPVAPKCASSQIIQTQPAPAAVKAQTSSQPDNVRKVATKKSKILKDEQPQVPQVQVDKSSTTAGLVTAQGPYPDTQYFAVQESITEVEQPAITHAQVPTQAQFTFSHAHEYQQPAENVSLHVKPVDTPIDDKYMDFEEEEEPADPEYETSTSFGNITTDFNTVTQVLNPNPDNKAARKEIAEAANYVNATRTAEDIEDEKWDTSMVAEYGDEIFEYMREVEARMRPNPHYMNEQTEIQWSMRGVLMDWVVQVHQRFNLLPETLFLTVNYIDRFLSVKIVSLGKLQLVGATAIFLAAKYEEVNCPTIQEIIYMVDNGYSAEELIKAERFMLSMLQFELGWPGPMSFLRRISKADDYDLETRTLSKYFLEVTIMDERFVGVKPSFLAAGAHCMARIMLRKGPWTQAHVYYSGYTFFQLQRTLKAIHRCCMNPQVHHGAVFEKYDDKRYRRASYFVQAEMEKGFTLSGMF
ncbi:unnamed protein product [Zymoseptoria tritici ST99CH_3D1]|nr:unnamed protein product [Zymoseptoria tritici ST99CH_3D1]